MEKARVLKPVVLGCVRFFLCNLARDMRFVAMWGRLLPRELVAGKVIQRS
jgi:hypothetical protein